ncbi:amidohydrolase [Cytobacillus solani]|uniref:Amidohydrolase n=1 Tax=Cytobacillus solani TaxID=1637975 RepID=A0A0Q3QRL4_9BACI|nr:amidohydrolase [Cytobacillus solani]KOP83740.1 amidohydrolase [Bacillus sp. FJAT-21945]KQL20817.1 amidohydrolase [Cytobacillus solani]
MGTLWYGGNIYTLQEANHQVEAVFTCADKIVEIGSIQSLEEKYGNEIVSRMDLQGRTMLPGFTDSHMHLIGHGERLIRLDLSNCLSKESVFQAVQQYAESLEEGEWLIGEGWNENLWKKSDPIVAAELDGLVPDHPVILKRVCRHALVVNSLALKAASINENTENPPGGVIEKDELGKPNGLLKDQAQELVFDVLPEVSEAYLKKALRAAIKDAYKLGFIGAHTEDLNYYGGYEKTFRAFKQVIEEEGKLFRAHLLVHHEVVDEMKNAGQHFLSGDDWIEFGAMKIFADGALGGRTALLSHPYADDPSTSGIAILSQQQLDDLIKKAREFKLPVAIHAIGDLAFEMALNAIEKYPITGEGRDRLIHAQILRKELIDRSKNLPLILDIQPRFLASDFPWVIDRIGEEHMNYCYAWKTLLNEGPPCAGGSDAPIEPLNPFLGIHAAVTRTNINDPEKKVYYQSEALTIYEAVCLFTKGSAYAASHENDRGVIKEGFLADFTILEEDIFKVTPDEIADIAVAQTVIGGQIVFDSKTNTSESPIQ